MPALSAGLAPPHSRLQRGLGERRIKIYLLYDGHICPSRLSTDLEVRRKVISFLPLDLARRHGNRDDADITGLAKAEIPCKNRGFRDWDRSDLNREPKDYEAVSECHLTLDDVEACGVLGFSVASKVALATVSDGCEPLISVAEADPQLARLIAAWPALSATVKRMILAALEAEQAHVP